MEPLTLASGDRFVFLGDSITRADPGYTRLFASMVNVRHPKVAVEWFYRGVSGNTVLHLIERLDRDVLALKPTWTAVSVGINDVWFLHEDGGDGVPLDAFQHGYRTLLSTLRQAGVRPLALTPSLIGDQLDDGPNQDLLTYAEAIRAEARTQGVPVVDVHRAFREAVAKTAGRLRLTADGVHMNLNGNVLLADTLYRALFSA